MKRGSELIWLTEKDVESLLTMKEVLEVIERAFYLHGRGLVEMPPKSYLDFDPFDGDLRVMPAYMKGSKRAAGVKIVNSCADNPAKGLPMVSGIMVYTDPETGLPLGLFAAGFLTAIRTGAGGGVAAKFLSRPDSEVVGLIGCGHQAKTQAEALSLLFSIKEFKVWGKTRQESAAFCKKFKGLLRARLTPCAGVKEACEADIVVTTTPVRTPLVKASWIRPGTHINAIGADAPGKQELDMKILSKARIIVDDRHQSAHGGEINRAVSMGEFDPEMIVAEIGEVVAGKVDGRLRRSDITLFDSTGLALQDVAVSQLLYEKAIHLKKGQVLKING